MISTKGRYALRVMVDIAEQPAGTNVPLHDIAARQGISKKYLEIIVRDLVQSGYLAGVSGRNGGYRLLRSPKDCSVGEVLTCMEGTLSPVACLVDGAAPCPRAAGCETLPMWQEYCTLTHEFFFGRTIADLLEAPGA